jgi:flagellar motor switch protein FliG
VIPQEQPKEKSNSKNIYIDGKNQVIQILRALAPEERSKLLNNMRKRNPALANELVLKSYSFLNLLDLEDFDLQLILRSVNHNILALAISHLEANHQKRILRLVDRSKAERTFEAMQAPSKKSHSAKAQNKILDIAAKLVEQRQISIIPE